MSSTQQVGEAVKVGGATDQAMLWSGTAASAVNLTPTGFGNSVADGTDGLYQVGSGLAPGTGFSHALLWTGTAASAVDLNPTAAGFESSAASAVDLNPTDLSGFTESEAYDTNGTEQVGYASGTAALDAMVWFGTADSAVDLSTLLPTTMTWKYSEALSVDATGNIYGWAWTTDNQVFAVEWSPVPEPSAAGILVTGIASLLCSRRPRLNCKS